MDTVTYPNKNVIEFSNQFVIPLRVRSDNPLAVDFNIQWTPALIVLDQDGKEQHRTVGFFSAEELIPSILLGIGIGHSGKNEFKEAIGCYEKILIDYSASQVAPEAVFQRGVNLYKNTHDPKHLKEAYRHLQEKYPASEWTKRADPYRLL
jgi:hypothetical protein